MPPASSSPAAHGRDIADGLVRAQPKSIDVTETWSAHFQIGANNSFRIEKDVRIACKVAVPLDDGECMPEDAWDDLKAITAQSAVPGRIGTLAFVAAEQDQRGSAQAGHKMALEDARWWHGDRWVSYSVDLPVTELESYGKNADARPGHDAIVAFELSAQHGDLRPVRISAHLATEEEILDFVHESPVGEAEARSVFAKKIADILIRPETERGDYQLILNIGVRAALQPKTKPQLRLKYFAIDWPYHSDGADVTLRSIPFERGDQNHEARRFVYNALVEKIELGDLALHTAWDDGFLNAKVYIRINNPIVLSKLENLKAEIALEIDGSLLRLTPLYADWRGEIAAGLPGGSKRPKVNHVSRADVRLDVDLKDLFEDQIYSCGYRLRLRGVEITQERIEYVRQILQERNMIMRNQAFPLKQQEQGSVGEREWLLVAERAVQADRLQMYSLVRCETRQVMAAYATAAGSEEDRFQQQEIGADTTVDILGVLKGKREQLIAEVNGYQKDLRSQLSRFARRR